LGGGKKNKNDKKKKMKAVVRDPHLLYEASVQNPEADLDFFARVFKKRRDRPLRMLREDFCGTALMACDWVRRSEHNHAWGVDFHRPTLDWGIARHVSRLGDARERLTLVCDDVRSVTEPKVEAVAALNFSYCVFKRRDELRGYFETVRRSLGPEGLFFVDVFGGTEATDTLEEERRIPASKAADGTRIPAFTYVWEQARFNVVDHHILCYIHFDLADGSRVKRAFRYDWRLWTLPELQEVMVEAGFKRADVYLEGWDEEEEDGDGVFRRRRFAENQGGWVGYVVGGV